MTQCPWVVLQGMGLEFGMQLGSLLGEGCGERSVC